VVEPWRKNLVLPCRRSEFETLELIDDLEQAIGTVKSRILTQVLPAKQETHEVRRRDRSDISS